MPQEPKRRHSRQRKGKRRAAIKLAIPSFTDCPNCGAIIAQHIVCPKCGYYKGKPFIQIEKEKPKETQEKEEESERLAQDKQETNAKE